MPTYFVSLTATALVRATVTVSADSPEAATAAALQDANDLDWQYEYDGVFDDTIEVHRCDPVVD